MRFFSEWFIQAPARILGELIGYSWPALVGVLAIWIGYHAYRWILDRTAKPIAVACAVILGFYVGMVLWDSQKWTAFALLETHGGERR
jgi:xanthosine utilization system XapX-like protein